MEGWCRAPTIFSSGKSFSLKGLKNYYTDSIFSFKLTYFVSQKKWRLISTTVFHILFSDGTNELATICKIKTKCLKF